MKQFPRTLIAIFVYISGIRLTIGVQWVQKSAISPGQGCSQPCSVYSNDLKVSGTVMTYFKFLDFSKVVGIANRTVGMLQ